MERIWKEFGKHTPAGKLLYDLYGVGFRPEEHISYPQIQTKKSTTNNTDNKSAKSSRTLKTERSKNQENLLSKINYPPITNRNQTKPLHKVDLIARRKNQTEIQKDLDKIKQENRPPVYNDNKNRKAQIEKLQDKFQYEEKTYLPQKARPPKIVLSDKDEEALMVNKEIDILNTKNHGSSNYPQKEDEITKLYNSILCEIDERYKFMNDMTKLGDTSQINRTMSEIKERIKELRTIEKLRHKQIENDK